MRTWTFTGTKQNRTYERTAANGGGRIKFDALSVQAPDAALVPEHDNYAAVKLTDEGLASLATGVKFASCVPQNLLCRTIGARLFVNSDECKQVLLSPVNPSLRLLSDV